MPAAPSGSSTVIAASGPYEEDPSPSKPIAGTPSKALILRSTYSSFASRRPRTSLSNDILTPGASTCKTSEKVVVFLTLCRTRSAPGRFDELSRFRLLVHSRLATGASEARERQAEAALRLDRSETGGDDPGFARRALA